MDARPALVVALAATTLLVVPLVGSGTAVAGPPSVRPVDADLHGNHVVVGPQVSADGTVVAEEAATLAPGFLVLRSDDGGQPGDPLGHTPLNGTAIRTDVSVAVDGEAWGDWPRNRTLWAVVHLDDGDGEFDPATDPSAAGRYPAAARQFEFGRGDAPVRILAHRSDPLALGNGTLTVRHVDLADDGHVVAHPLDDDRVVGTRGLPAGSHGNVSLELDESFVAEQDPRFRVRLTLYHDDGDGEFDDESPVLVGGERVETTVVVRRIAGRRTTEPLVVTPSPSPSPDPASERDTNPDSTATLATTASGNTPGVGPTGATPGPSTATDASGPGFGAALAFGSILTWTVVSYRSRRRGTRREEANAPQPESE